MSAKARQVVEEDLANVEFETSEDVEVIPTFDSMGLREDLLRREVKLLCLRHGFKTFFSELVLFEVGLFEFLALLKHCNKFVRWVV